ncbi:ankyrin repeat domain-containing protein [Leptolyngbya sp. CCY15150]|uniref:ankyrin repeat domain-containing protein n=1 Tax=Leptolyngbya sp. CCY15150 TaxID=2767772 RepID=UPI00194E621C|nr:ankyrin repeat domain-containing protein [Leptolyngbya sp. CCY15150]
MSRTFNSVWDIDLQDTHALSNLHTFLSNGGDPNETRFINGYSQSFIYKATREKKIDAIELLARAGADVDLTGKEQMSFGSALLAASELGYLEICRLLIDCGADVNLHGKGTLLPGTLNLSYVGTSPLHRAAEKGHSTIVKLLLEHGANPNVLIEPIPFLMNLDTPIAAAARTGKLETLQTLLKGGADIDFMHPIGFSALHEAVRFSHLEAVKLLLESDADINKRGSFFGITPLYLAQDIGRRKASIANTEIQKYLAQNGGISYIHWWYYPLIMLGFGFSYY